MKKFILPMLVILTTIFANAQVEQFICATEDIDMSTLEGVFSGSNDPEYLYGMDPVVLNIYYWRVDAPDGSVHPNALTEYRALESVAYLNINYNPIGIYFKYRGMGNFSSPQNVPAVIKDFELDACVEFGYVDPDGYETLSQCQDTDLTNYAVNNGYVEANSFNIYVPRELTDFGGVRLGWTTIVTSPGGLISDTIKHEIGHGFSLDHTWKNWYQPDNPEACEHVTRIKYDSNFNADEKGDLLIGTAAMPNFLVEHCLLNDLPTSDCIYESSPYHFEYYDIDNCIYIGTVGLNNRTDCKGATFQISPVDARNTMSYAPTNCRDNFSIDQGIQMREFISNNSTIQDAITDVPSLYEPYSGEYYIAGPQPTEHPPLFQPGFEYRFIECACSCSAPAGWFTVFTYNTNTVLNTIHIDETDFTAITHPNHSAIWIKQEINGEEVFPQPRKCYDNYNKNPSGGSITKFNDDVFNTNVTISSQDSTAINNQNLIQNLESGLYKIEKNYEDGAIQETIIYKDNN